MVMALRCIKNMARPFLGWVKKDITAHLKLREPIKYRVWKQREFQVGNDLLMFLLTGKALHP